MTKHRAVRLRFWKCRGDHCNSQGCDRVAFANCENFVHFIFDRIGGRGSGGATGQRAPHALLQPSELSECGKIVSRWSIPSTGAIASAKLQSDILVAIEIRSGVPVSEFDVASVSRAAALGFRDLSVVAVD